MNKNFFLPDGYVSNPYIAHGENEGLVYWNERRINSSKNYQKKVYEFARNTADVHGLKSIVDIGCGPGTKLARFFQAEDFQIKGYDVSSAVKIAKKINPEIDFDECDLSKLPIVSRNKWDLVISADVIEHLDNPDILLQSARNLLKKDGYFILSTPDRSVLYGNNMLRPGNIQHVREWTINELSQYILSSGFRIEQAFLEESYGPAFDKIFFQSKFLMGKKTKHCSIILCRLSH